MSQAGKEAFSRLLGCEPSELSHKLVGIEHQAQDETIHSQADTKYVIQGGVQLQLP